MPDIWSPHASYPVKKGTILRMTEKTGAHLEIERNICLGQVHEQPGGHVDGTNQVELRVFQPAENTCLGQGRLTLLVTEI